MRMLLLVALLLPGLGFAGVGKVELLEGKAQRTPAQGSAAALSQGSTLELGDQLQVTQGNLKLRLSDGSVVMLSQGAALVLDEARFKGQERQSVSLRLLAGKLWAKVTKSVGGAKFEVVTARAVAGVRGTVLRVDVLPRMGELHPVCVCVFEGEVEVWSGVPRPPPMALAMAEVAEERKPGGPMRLQKEMAPAPPKAVPPASPPVAPSEAADEAQVRAQAQPEVPAPLRDTSLQVSKVHLPGAHHFITSEDPKAAPGAGHKDDFTAFVLKHQ